MKLWPLAAFVTVACFSSAHVLSNPVAPTVVNGNASFNQSGNVLTVTNSNGAIINWNRFSIATGETTQFVQPSTSSGVLNRVLSDPSTIHGTLSSNGQVFLVNPSGIYVGPGGRIDAGGIFLSTGNISNADFLGGNIRFDPPPPSTPIVISGRLDAAGNIEIRSSVLDCSSGCTLNSRTGSISIDPADIVVFPPPLPLSKASVPLTPTLMVSSLSVLPPVVPAAPGMLTMGGNITLTGVSSGFPSPPGGGTVTLSAGTAPTGNISLGGGNITLAGSSGPISLGSAPSTPSAAPDPSAAAGPAPLPVRAATPVRPVNTGGLADGTVTVRVSLVDASPITLR
ncbi:MAG: filamentous hemagglutinin outer membrane protein [Rhodocyclaceae bacterium]|nr:MAG: filamentous hemagglutinin outer membrane protein [Rhodocyclaceae bacterium]TND04723.1 MAG: filamentous hemagglutinin outer membrane protein [Rhodocyclaceae bacterium]